MDLPKLNFRDHGRTAFRGPGMVFWFPPTDRTQPRPAPGRR